MQQYKDVLPYYVSFINDINEDITEGSDREQLVVAKVLKSFKSIITINELIEVLVPNVSQLRAIQAIAQDGIPTNTIANVSLETQSSQSPYEFDESSVTWLSLSPIRTVSECLNSSVNNVCYFSELTRAHVTSFLTYSLALLQTCNNRQDQLLAIYSLTKLFLKRNDGMLSVYDIVGKSDQKLTAAFLKQLHECMNNANIVREVKILLYRVLEEITIVCPDRLNRE